ncbi:Ras-related protein Rab-11A [Thelohanellus kitauei]|uniref:Ras-related protein Rab-11A n=1 Tax=Thelohanellus kitauei TaxID=669202 RepID=A0A0C2N442_THEKT|nr:Ras-related protein Rab-11A [Thelohanellus kitauei]
MLDISSEFDISYKVLLLGDSGVGKSQLLSRFVKQELNMHSKSTIGVEFGSRLIEIDGKVVKVMIWDTAGQERYRSILNTYYRGAVGVILVYDITKHQSFENLAIWLTEIQEHVNKNTGIILIGNKTDIRDHRAVSLEEGQQFAITHGINFLEASALDTTNVEIALETLIKDIYKMIPAQKSGSDNDSKLVDISKNLQNNSTSKKKSKCC